MHKLWQITREPGQEKFRRKKTCASAQVGARNEYEMRTEKFTNQYLWDLNCGCCRYASPQGKSKEIPLSATRCVEWFLLLHMDDRQKKTCASAQVGEIQVLNHQVELTYQYLWDTHSINGYHCGSSGQ